VDFGFFRNPQFWILALSNVLQGLAYYIPSLYLPTFATLVGLSPRVGALLLAAHNLASIVGQVGFGHLSDRFNNIFILIFITTFVSGIASFCIWGFARSLAPLLAYAIIFGSFAGSYVVFWTTFSSLLSEDTQSVYNLMVFGKGIGSVVTGPITGSLLSRPVSSGYGLGKYQPVVIYIGSLMLASSLGIFAWPIQGRPIKR
jgi:MFS family permease